MEADPAILAFLAMKTKTPVSNVYVESTPVSQDAEISAFLKLKTKAPAKPQATISSLMQLMTGNGARVGAQQFNSPANSHDAQKTQLRADLRSAHGKSTLSFPMLSSDLRMNAY